MNIVKSVLEWNKKLFPVLIVIFLVLVLINSLKFDFITVYPRLFSLNYKLLIILVSGGLVLVDYYLRKSKETLL